MLRNLVLLVMGNLCGQLFIKWFPITTPIGISEVIVIIVLEPVAFVMAMIVFIIGFTVNAKVIREGIAITLIFVREKRIKLFELLGTYLIFVSFLSLYTIGSWQTIIFFCFSIIYGIISLDFKNKILA